MLTAHQESSSVRALSVIPFFIAQISSVNWNVFSFAKPEDTDVHMWDWKASKCRYGANSSTSVLAASFSRRKHGGKGKCVLTSSAPAFSAIRSIFLVPAAVISRLGGVWVSLLVD